MLIKSTLGRIYIGCFNFIFPTLLVRGYESIKVLSENNPGKIRKHSLAISNNSWVLLIFVGLTMIKVLLQELP
jgi:CIC family chloride channel protein